MPALSRDQQSDNNGGDGWHITEGPDGSPCASVAVGLPGGIMLLVMQSAEAEKHILTVIR
jgi:hypothetical protein